MTIRTRLDAIERKLHDSRDDFRATFAPLAYVRITLAAGDPIPFEPAELSELEAAYDAACGHPGGFVALCEATEDTGAAWFKRLHDIHQAACDRLANIGRLGPVAEALMPMQVTR
jgi:hypothetical protein